MPTLYIITGPSGVGKTTTSKKLAEKLTKSVFINGDDIYHQVIGSCVSAWKPGNHLPIFWEICFNMFEIYLKNGYDVVFNYIINAETIEEIKDKFKNYTIKFIVLMIDKQTLLLRDSKRPKDCQMKERCIILLDKFKSRNYDSKNILDTFSLSVDEVVDTIYNNENFVL